MNRRLCVFLMMVFIFILPQKAFAFGLDEDVDTQIVNDNESEVAAEGQVLPDVYIEVNIPAIELSLYENGQVKFTKPIAIGSGVYPTPEQESLIKRIEWNPWWYPPPSKWAADATVTPPGPGNPLGLVKMPLSEAILIHGTNKARSIGHAASHGCMRMLNEDAVELAWYLQQNFSGKNDPAFLEKYRKNRRTTFVVFLDVPVQVRLVYKPVLIRNGAIVFYKDHYRKIANKKKEAIMAELAKAQIPDQCIDEPTVGEIAKDWPDKGTEIPLKSVLVSGKQVDASCNELFLALSKSELLQK